MDIRNAAGLVCPMCETNETEVEAVLPLLSEDFPTAVDPHAYAICTTCHDRQVEDKLAGKQSVTVGSYSGNAPAS